MLEEQRENNLKEQPVILSKDNYDFDGLIRIFDSQGAVFILTFEDIDESKHYMNRYQSLELYLSVDQKLSIINHYLKQDEEQGVFIPFAVNDKGNLKILGSGLRKDIDSGELELGENMIYGMLIRESDENYVFDEMVYFDGDNKNHSWAEKVLDAGELTYILEKSILEFKD